MAGPLTAAVLLRLRKFKAYQREIVRVLTQRKRGNANTSNDADLLLPDWNWVKLLQAARAALAAHMARTDNPHQETMSTIGSYTATQITAIAAKKVPLAVMPFSTYGLMDTPLDDAGMNALWSSAGFVVSINASLTVILSGTPYTLPAGSIDLSTIEVNPANKTFNIFVRSRFGRVSYEARIDSPPESVSVMFIGQVITDGSGVVSRSFVTVTRVDTFRIGNEPRGSVIPVAKGTIDTPTKFPATWKPV